MNAFTSSSSVSAGTASSQAASAAPRDSGTSERQRFDSALRRAAERRDHDDTPADDDAAPAALPAVAPPALLPQAAVAPLTAPVSPAVAEVAAHTAPTPSVPLSLDQFAACLSRLHAPADAQGVQQWQFMLAERSVPLAAVQVQTVAGGPFQLTLQAHTLRDRQTLHSQLDKLRERLQTRGAPVGELRLGDAGDALA
jgi:hypothetical protein